MTRGRMGQGAGDAMLAIHPGDHVGAPFARAEQFAATAVAFTEQAIRSAARVMVFPGDPHRDDPDAFRRFLGEHSPAVAAAAARGQVQVADSRRVQLAPGRFDPGYLHQAYAAATARAISDGYRGLWVTVDMCWAAGVDPAALAAFEAGAFTLFAGRQLTALCQYDARVFPAGAAAAACAAHPAALDSLRPLRHGRPRSDVLCLTGETDLSNHTAFVALLGSLRPGDTLDITAMTFIDVPGLAAIDDRRRLIPHLTVRAAPSHGQLLTMLDRRTPDR